MLLNPLLFLNINDESYEIILNLINILTNGNNIFDLYFLII